MEEMKVADKIVLSLSGKPKLKEKIEEEWKKFNSQRVEPYSTSEFCIELIERGIRN